MRNEALAATAFGVQTVSVLDKDAVRDLALFLCREAESHVDSPTHKCSPDCDCDKRFERECKRNGGYCDPCRDFAGKLLSRFDMRVNDSIAQQGEELGPF